MQSFRRGQSSLELLLVAAALLVFFVVLLPSFSRVYEGVRFHSVNSAQGEVLERLASYSREAFLLGQDTRFSFDAFLPADSTSITCGVAAGGLEGGLSMSFSAFGRQGSFEKPLVACSSDAFLEDGMPSGKYSFLIANSGGKVEISARQAE